MKSNFIALILILTATLSTNTFADNGGQDIEASTSNGDKVILHANGRWEFVDAKKAVEAKAIADQYPDGNAACPPGWQGMGIGRCIPPGDKDFHRKSMGGK